MIFKTYHRSKNYTRQIGLIFLLACLLMGCKTTTDNNHTLAQDKTKPTEFMLSFDDGPMPDTTESVLKTLATLRAVDGMPVKAGFFLVADAPNDFWQRRLYFAPYEAWTDKGSIVKYPLVAKHIKQAGHTIGNHTTHHAWFLGPWLNSKESVVNEFTEWERISSQVLGKSQPRLFRPPYFVLTETVLETTRQLGYQIVMGESVGDTNPFLSVADVMEKTQAILANWDKPYPCVLTFHDNRPVTYNHLDEIVGNLQKHGFRLVHFDPKRL